MCLRELAAVNALAGQGDSSRTDSEEVEGIPKSAEVERAEGGGEGSLHAEGGVDGGSQQSVRADVESAIDIGADDSISVMVSQIDHSQATSTQGGSACTSPVLWV